MAHAHLFSSPACSQDVLPSITQHPTGGTYGEGSEVTLSCEVQDATAIEWSHNGVMVTEGDGVVIGENSLTIAILSADHTGNYTCLASNSIGIITSAIAEIELAGECVVSQIILCEF